MWLGVGLKNGHQEDIMCSKDTELPAQNLLTVLGPLVNIMGGGRGYLVVLWLQHF